MTRRSVLLLALATLIPVSLYVLHDPPWIAGSTYGFFPVEADQDGRAFRWTGGHASFFVPESAVSITLELAGHAVYDVTVTILTRK